MLNNKIANHNYIEQYSFRSGFHNFKYTKTCDSKCVLLDFQQDFGFMVILEIHVETEKKFNSKFLFDVGSNQYKTDVLISLNDKTYSLIIDELSKISECD
jgi:hypothetical protein